MVHRKFKFIFVHITKTGGCSVLRALSCNEIRDHRTAMDIRSAVESRKEKWTDYFKFSFVRNPWERLISIYFYCKGRNEPIIRDFGSPEFHTWLPVALNQCNKKHEYRVYLSSQLSRITDGKGNIIVDFIGRNETIESDVKILQNKLNLPFRQVKHINVSYHKHYSYYYSPFLIDLVSKKYKEDIEYFGYKYEQMVEPQNTIESPPQEVTFL